jgi:hypothetical protein
MDDCRIVRGGGWMKMVPKDARGDGEYFGGGFSAWVSILTEI